ncbi:IS3 family transposase [Bacillus thuringiensis]|uniref:IS3 family transposase n=1 Tax=Bacillus thuringiensis TaxID=1428 RepID=UPI003BF6A629
MNNTRLASDKRLKKGIQSIHVKHKEYGYPCMKIALEEEGYFITHKKVYRLMSELNIQSIIRKQRRFFIFIITKLFLGKFPSVMIMNLY